MGKKKGLLFYLFWFLYDLFSLKKNFKQENNGSSQKSNHSSCFILFEKEEKNNTRSGHFVPEKVFPFRRNKKMPVIDYIAQGVIIMDPYNALLVVYAPIYYK
jgi:hypothetical protein